MSLPTIGCLLLLLLSLQESTGTSTFRRLERITSRSSGSLDGGLSGGSHSESVSSSSVVSGISGISSSRSSVSSTSRFRQQRQLNHSPSDLGINVGPYLTLTRSGLMRDLDLDVLSGLVRLGVNRADVRSGGERRLVSLDLFGAPFLLLR